MRVRKAMEDIQRGSDLDRQGIFDILDHQMSHGASKAFSKYLLSQINRDLHLHGRASARPTASLQCSEIEDLLEIMGPDFHSPILELPGIKSRLRDLMMSSLRSALQSATSLMFDCKNDHMLLDKESRTLRQDIDTLRMSQTFPNAIARVYPSKASVPDPADPVFDIFSERFAQMVLGRRSFVRSVKTLIITNALGADALKTVNVGPTKLSSFVPSVIADLTRRYMTTDGRNDFTDSVGVRALESVLAHDYQDFISGQDESGPFGDYFINDAVDAARIAESIFPVDVKLFATQYKKDPREGVIAFDMFSLLDQDPGERAIYLGRARPDQLIIS
jgi:hypothetical protein